MTQQRLPLDVGRLRLAFPARRIEYFPSIDSTMSAAATLELGGIVLADEQTSGKGRLGRAWHSEAREGIYCSIVLESRPMLTLALALAARRAIQAATGIDCDIRWPNDLLIGGKKTAGILVQASGQRAIAGIGVNVNNSAFPPELEREATSLALHSPAAAPYSREEILLALIPAIDDYARLDGEAILSAFGKASSYVNGKRVSVEREDGPLLGVTAGLDAAGFLKVRKDDGSETLVLAGGVRAAGA
jgi:BirA family transcriptional regulator, biotin operon repressor / biotin---[acetyl-CoA-carboxylase] ligase